MKQLGHVLGCSAKGLGNRTAGLLDLRLGGGRAGDLHGELLRELAVAEDLDLRLLVVREARLRERLDRDLGAGFELLLEVRNVDGERLRVERGVVEAALRKTTDERHLAAFEHQFVLVTLARLLALLSLAGRLAHARAPLLAHPFGARLRRGGYSSAADKHMRRAQYY